jgi:glycosyltransferase XagB
MVHFLKATARDRIPDETATAGGAQIKQLKARPRLPLGSILVENGLITREQLSEALANQSRWGSRLGDIVLAMGWVKPLALYRALASQLRLEFVNLMHQPPDDTLFDPAHYQDYAKHLYVPWRRRHGKLWVATADPDSRELAAAWAGQDVGLVVTSKFDVIWEVQRVARSTFSEDAVYHLATFDPAHSARIVVTRGQKVSFVTGCLLTAAALWFAPIATLMVLNSVVNFFLFFSFAFRTVLCWMSCAEEDPAITAAEIQQLHDVELPVYTVLVPMYREPTVLPILAAALRNLDYPRSKLDIKLVLEEDDQETIEAAKALALDSTFEIVRVPSSQPKTKPKACNYALRFARGEYLTIYDAEDQPEPDQLKKALVGFRKLGPKAACLQARLNFFNAGENWLTRMFALEYSLWFDMFLPALDRLRVPIPLGGTSNHFDIAKLREVGGWDPFNVTEDADLGLRFASCGYQVGVINSVTFEEANSQAGNWIRQRSRWIKGYMQTWLVNMRNPVALCRRVGWKGFLTLQLFIGGGVVSALSYPFLALAFLYWLITRGAALEPFFPPAVLLVSVLNLIMGNSYLIYLSMLAVAKRRNFDLLPHALTVPGYWLLLSAAAYKGLWQLIRNPFFWEKTTHGISKFTNDQLDRASHAA